MPTNGMTIDGLNTVSSLTAQDEVPVWDKEASGEPTRKITAQNFASSVKTLGSLLGTSDVVNDLSSTSTTAPLAAAQGKALNDKIIKKNSYATGFDVSVASSGCHFYCDRVGKFIFIDIVILFTSAVAINTQIAHINGISDILDAHASTIGSNGTGARFLLVSNGILKVERALPANEWFSLSFIAMYNRDV